MATQFMGINRGQRLADVATGTSTTGKSLELAVNDAVGWTRGEVVLALETLKQAILDTRTTPFAQ